MKKIFSYAVISALLCLISILTYAGNYSWTGTTSTSWTTTTNWSPNGAPSTNDTVTITNQTNNPVLATGTSIKKFTMTSGTLDCNGYTLTISATATFNGGTINNGTVTCNGTSTLTFAGTTFGAAVGATGNSILLNGSRFNSTFTAVKKGTSNDSGNGNNYFSGAVSITDSSSGNLVLSNNSSAPDTFNSTVSFAATSTGGLYIAHQGSGNVFNGDVTFNTGNIFSNTYGTAAYNGNITLNSASGSITFGNSTGSWTLANNKNISIGTFSAGTLTIRNLTQSDGSINMRLVLSGTARLILGSGNSISANLYGSSNQLSFTQSRFYGVDTLIFTGGNTQFSGGGSNFGSTVYIANTATPTNYIFSTGSTYVDTFSTTTTFATTAAATMAVTNALFQGAVTFKNSITGTGTPRFFANDCIFKGALTLDCIGNGITFRNGTGNTILDSTASLTLVSGYSGQLTLSHFEQRGSNAISLDMTTTSSGANTILTVGPSAKFNSNFTYVGQRLYLNGGTFNSNTSFKRMSSSVDISDGGNVFNGTAYICDSVSSTNTNNKPLILANTTADDFNGNVTFKLYAYGSSPTYVKFNPAYGANSTFAGNITVDGNSVIDFSGNGGKVIFDGSNTQSLIKAGSSTPTFKRIQVNKSAGYVSLGFPLTLADTLFLIKGIIISDTTNVITVPDNGIVSGGSDSAYIHGPLKKVGNDAFVFALGDTVLHTYSYHPITISAPSDSTHAFTGRYFRQQQSLGSSADTTMENMSSCEYWKLDRTTGSSNVYVTLGWNNNSCNVYTLSKMKVAHWNGTKWTDKGNSATSGNTSVGNVRSSAAVTSFGYFTLSDSVCTTLSTVASSSSESCSGSNDGVASVIASLGTSPYTYSWSPGSATTSSISGLAHATYTVTVTDNNHCARSDSSVVSLRSAVTYTWNGSASSMWGTAANWTPSGVPISCDNVVIASSSHNPQLSSNTSVSSFTINSGTLNLNSYSLFVTGIAHFNSGAVNSGTVTIANTDSSVFQGTQFGGYVSCTSNNILLNGSTFNDSLTVIKKGSSNNSSAGGNVFNGAVCIIDSGSGNITLANSQIDDFNSSLKLIQASSGFIYPSSTKTTSIAGNIMLLGSTAITFGNNGGKVLIDGSGSQSITQSGTFDMTVASFEINKPSGAFTLNKPFTITDSLILIKGIINSDSINYITVESGGITIGATDSSFVNGPVLKVGNDQFIFPVGKNGKYRPIAMSGLTAFSTFSGEYFSSDPDLLYDITLKDSSIDEISRCEYWKLNRIVGSASAFVTIGWDSNFCDLPYSAHSIVRWNGVKWIDEFAGEIVGNYGIGTLITPFLISSFSPFTLSSQANGLSGLTQPSEKPYRGLHVDRILNIISPNSGNHYVDINYSFLGTGTYYPDLGLYEHEKELLEYCKENHITYLVVFDLPEIFNEVNSTTPINHPNGEEIMDNLCRFMTIAKNNYFIEDFSAAVSSTGEWTDAGLYNNSIAAIQLTTNERAFFGNNQSMINAIEDNSLSEADPLFRKSQCARGALLINRFNTIGDCPDFDVCTTEDEFWGTDDPAEVTAFKGLCEDLRDMTPISLEAYIAYFNQWYTHPDQSFVDYLDGYENGGTGSIRLVDRFSLLFYNQYDEQNTDPYLNSYWPYVERNDYLSYWNMTSNNLSGTIIHGLYSGESINNGGSDNYNGYWILEPNSGSEPGISRNIFTVEKYQYKSWRNHLNAYSPGDPPYYNEPGENILKPGSNTWFSSPFMIPYFDKPTTFYQNLTLDCASSAQAVQFKYCGPPEPNIDYIFSFRDFSGNDVIIPRYGTVENLESDPTSDVISAANLTVENVPVSTDPYTAELTLKYKDHSEPPNYIGSYTYSQEVYVDGDPHIVVYGAVANVACQGELITLIATIGSHIQWYKNNTIISGATNQFYTLDKNNDVGSSMVFSYIVSSGDMVCPSETASVSITVYQNPLPCLTSSFQPNTTSITLTASSPYSTASYLWPDGSNGTTVTSFIADKIDKYLVTVTNEGGCTRKLKLDIPKQPKITSSALCPPCSLTVDNLFNSTANIYWYIYDPLTDHWNSASPCSTCTSIWVTDPGYYRVADIKNYSPTAPACSFDKCQVSKAKEIGVAITQATIVNPSCSGGNNGSITLTGPTGNAYQYTWTGNISTTNSATSLGTGSYTISIYNPNSTCTLSEVIDLYQIGLDLTYTQSNINCFGNHNGSATVTPHNGSSPYLYSWSSGGNTNTETNLSPGVYICTVEDASGTTCTGQVTVTITSPTELTSSMNYLGTNNISCIGMNDGSAEVSVLGGTPPYSYLWSGGGTAAQKINLSPNNYSVTVTDDNGCTSTTNVTISNPWGACNEAENYCSPSGVPIKTSGLSAFFTPSNTIGIHSNLEVDNYFEINDNDVVIDPDMSITVTPTGNLVIKGGSTLSPCTDMWKGIKVKSGGQLTVNGSSTIRGAEFGVDIDENAIITLDDASFIDNYIGLINTPSSTIFSPFTFSMRGTSFSGTGSLPACIPCLHAIGNYPYAGIVFKNANQNVGIAGTSLNHFDDMNNGIMLDNTISFIRNCEFSNIKGDPFYTTSIKGCGIYDTASTLGWYPLKVRGLGFYNLTPTFSHCDTAIRTFGIPSSILANRMESVGIGVSVSGCDAGMSTTISSNNISCLRRGVVSIANPASYLIQVRGNSITVDDPITPVGNYAVVFEEGNLGINGDYRAWGNTITLDHARSGIFLQNISNALVGDNNIEMLNMAKNVNGMIQLGCDGNDWHCNDIEGHYHFPGLRGQDAYVTGLSANSYIACNTCSLVNRGIVFQNLCSNSDFRGNEMKRQFQGLSVVGSGAATGIQDNPGNIWTGPFSALFDAYNTGNPNDSKYRVDGTFTFNQPSNPNVAGWFVPENDGEYICPSCIEVRYRSNDANQISILDRLIASHSFVSGGELESETKWISEKQLASKLLQYPELDTETVLIDFMDSIMFSTIESFALILDSINKAYNVDSTINAELIYNDSVISNYSEIISDYDSMLYSGLLDHDDSLEICFARNSLKSSSEFLSEVNKQSLQNIISDRNEKINRIIIQNDTISTSLDIEDNDKIVNNIYLNTIAKNNFEFSSDQQATLFTIANKCPGEAGTAVFRARSIYHLIDPEYLFEDDSLCSDTCTIPTMPIISGPENGQCGQSGVSYSIGSISGATGYTWYSSDSDYAVYAGPNNLTAVSVDFADSLKEVTLYARAYNSCGSSDVGAVIIYGGPLAPDTIEGNTSVCAYDVEVYTTNATTGATSINWTVPVGSTILGGAGSTSILLLWGSTGGDLEVTASNDCDISEVVILGVDVTCRQAEQSNLSNVVMYPNPTTGQVTIQFYSLIDATYLIEIEDVLGRVLMEKSLKSNNGDNSLFLDFSKYMKGVYFVNLKFDGTTKTMKLILN